MSASYAYTFNGETRYVSSTIWTDQGDWDPLVQYTVNDYVRYGTGSSHFICVVQPPVPGVAPDIKDYWALVVPLTMSTPEPGTTTLSGSVDPEGLVRAAPGTLYSNIQTGSFWVKRSGGTGTTGWMLIVQGNL